MSEVHVIFGSVQFCVNEMYYGVRPLPPIRIRVSRLLDIRVFFSLLSFSLFGDEQMTPLDSLCTLFLALRLLFASWIRFPSHSLASVVPQPHSISSQLFQWSAWLLNRIVIDVLVVVNDFFEFRFYCCQCCRLVGYYRRGIINFYVAATSFCGCRRAFSLSVRMNDSWTIRDHSILNLVAMEIQLYSLMWFVERNLGNASVSSRH